MNRHTIGSNQLQGRESVAKSRLGRQNSWDMLEYNESDRQITDFVIFGFENLNQINQNLVASQGRLC
jgi:hypothetical protein